MTKQLLVGLAGQDKKVEVEINESTTAADVLKKVGCPKDYRLLPGVGMPPFGATERIYDRIRDGGKAVAAPPADAGFTTR